MLRSPFSWNYTLGTRGVVRIDVRESILLVMIWLNPTRACLKLQQEQRDTKRPEHFNPTRVRLKPRLCHRQSPGHGFNPTRVRLKLDEILELHLRFEASTPRGFV